MNNPYTIPANYTASITGEVYEFIYNTTGGGNVWVMYNFVK